MSDAISHAALFNTRTPGAPEQPMPTPWTDLVLENGFAAVPGERVPQFRMDSSGTFWFQGELDASGAASETFATLPFPIRPTSFAITVNAALNATAGLINVPIRVGIDGLVTIAGLLGLPGRANVSLSFQINRFV